MKNTGFLDIHSHILPDVDDGPRTWDMTTAMLEAAYQQGVRHLVATPHNYPGNKKQDNEKIKELCAKANDIAQQIDQDFHVYSGNEVLYREGITEEIRAGHILTLAESSYVLVEFLPGASYKEVFRGIRELTEQCYYPVIAHMERVNELYGREDRIDEIIEAGGYIQVNCESLMGGVFNRRTALLRKWIENGKVHFLGSDCHNMTERPPLMKDCTDKLEKKITEYAAMRLLVQNKEKFLNKEFI